VIDRRHCRADRRRAQHRGNRKVFVVFNAHRSWILTTHERSPHEMRGLTPRRLPFYITDQSVINRQPVPAQAPRGTRS
jgi:hypothetical protein